MKPKRRFRWAGLIGARSVRPQLTRDPHGYTMPHGRCFSGWAAERNLLEPGDRRAYSQSKLYMHIKYV
jgi:hypothetical protein